MSFRRGRRAFGYVASSAASPPPLSNAKNITSFTIPAYGVTADIVGTDISAELPHGTDLSTVIPTIVITGVSVAPASGATEDFTGGPIDYVVTAENATSKTYSVTVTAAEGNPIADLTGLRFVLDPANAAFDVDSNITQFNSSSLYGTPAVLPWVSNTIAATHQQNSAFNAQPYADFINGRSGNVIGFNMGDWSSWTAGEIFVVLIADSGGSGGIHWLDTATTDSLYPAEDDFVIRDAFGSDTRKDVGTPSENIALPQVLNIRSQAGEWVYRLTSTTMLTTSDTVVSFPSLALFGYSNKEFRHQFVGKMAFLVACDEVQTDEQREAAITYLMGLYGVQILSNAKNITSFVIDGNSGSISDFGTSGHVDLNMPFGTDLSALAPTITVSALASISPLSGDTLDFTSPQSYSVTAQNGTSKNWTATVTANSSACDMLNYGVYLPDFSEFYPGIIAGLNISVDIPTGTDVTALLGQISVSDGASSSPGNFQSIDLTSPVIYTVTAQDGIHQQNYTVTAHFV